MHCHSSLGLWYNVCNRGHGFLIWPIFSSSEFSANSSSFYSLTVAQPCPLLSAILINFCLISINFWSSCNNLWAFSAAGGHCATAVSAESSLLLTSLINLNCHSWLFECWLLIQRNSLHEELVGRISLVFEFLSQLWQLVVEVCLHPPNGHKDFSQLTSFRRCWAGVFTTSSSR